ncbi:MAG: hypothetical protein ABIQ31_09890 [Ferruginibacter sp.]
MKQTKLLFAIVQFAWVSALPAQQIEFVPDLSKVNDSKLWSVSNREVKYDSVVYLNGKPGDGALWLNGSNFKNGEIEIDIKGNDVPGMSFVGVAFHGLNDSTYEAIYFRPFNFKNLRRNDHSVQYIAHPQYTWNRLRDEHPGKYEQKVSPVPDPAGWFHALIVIKFPVVKVFINHSGEPSLIINQLSNRQEGKVGLWVGNNSEGYFKNLRIITK